MVTICLGNDLVDNVNYSPYNHPKPYVTLSADGESFEIMGYPLPLTKETGPYLVGAASVSRLAGMIKLAYDTMDKRKGEAFTSVDEPLIYVRPEGLLPAERKLVKDVFKLNELLLAAIRHKVDQTLGINRLAVVLAPTKLELGDGLSWRASDRNIVGDAVRASLARLVSLSSTAAMSSTNQIFG